MAMTDLLDGNATLVSDVSSDYQTRKESQRCTYPGCGRPPVDGQAQCAKHGDEERARKRAWIRARRKKWQDAKLCTRCGGKRAPRSKWGCPKCVIEVGGRKDNLVATHVDKSQRLAARTAVDATGRTRYHGQARTGPLSKAAADEQDLAAAKKCIDRAIEGLALARSPEVQQLPRIQREEAKRAALSQADHGAAFLGEVFVRNRYDAVNLVLRERDDED